MDSPPTHVEAAPATAPSEPRTSRPAPLKPAGTPADTRSVGQSGRTSLYLLSVLSAYAGFLALSWLGAALLERHGGAVLGSYLGSFVLVGVSLAFLVFAVLVLLPDVILRIRRGAQASEERFPDSPEDSVSEPGEPSRPVDREAPHRHASPAA